MHSRNGGSTNESSDTDAHDHMLYIFKIPLSISTSTYSWNPSASLKNRNHLIIVMNVSFPSCPNHSQSWALISPNSEPRRMSLVYIASCSLLAAARRTVTYLPLHAAALRSHSLDHSISSTQLWKNQHFSALILVLVFHFISSWDVKFSQSEP